MKVFKNFGTALTRLNAYVKEHDGRYSPVREMVLEQACQLPQPFTAEQLVQACSKDRISSGSVYNALKLFAKAQLVHPLERQRGQRIATEYELVAGSPIRMQTVCEKCGRMTVFHDQAIERIVRERKYMNFNTEHFTLLVYGVCKKCRQTKNKK